MALVTDAEQAAPKTTSRYPAHVILTLLACALVSADDLAARMDLDGDGVLRPDDCDDGDADLGAPTASYPDADGDGAGAGEAAIACVAADGYVGSNNDCDDTLSDVSPTASELCNGRDDNCDGVTDEDAAEDAPVWYADTDADGFGDPLAPHPACSQPSGFLADNTDCDDTAGSVHPGADDAWYDGVDGNCDGASDYDADGDGTDGTEFGGTDCDDAEPTTHVGGDDICGDDVDNDCLDGDVGPCAFSGEVELSDADLTIYGDAFQAGIGGAYAVADVTGDGVVEVLVSGAFVTRPDYAGIAVLSTPIAEFDSVERATVFINGVDNMRVGSSMDVGDFDGDGVNDVLAGSWGGGEWGKWHGSATIVSGPITASERMDEAAFYMLGPEENYYLGGAVTNAGDIDGDGDDEALIGAKPEGGRRPGEFYLVRGDSAGIGATAPELFVGTASGDGVGTAFAGGEDFDGDGLDDVFVGAERATAWGKVYCLLGPISDVAGMDDADFVLNGDSNDGAGAFLEVGQLDGDGAADLVVAAPTKAGTDGVGRGAVYVVRGPLTGDRLFAESDAILYAGESGEVGIVSAGGDLDGNGTSDIAISTGSATSAYVSVFLTPVSGVYRLGDASGRVMRAAGDVERGIGGIGDVDDDGFSDLLLGRSTDDTAFEDAGVVHIYLGGP